MRKFTLILMLAVTLLGVANAQTRDHLYFAADFNQWSVPGNQGANVYVWPQPTYCVTPSLYGGQFPSFTTAVPLYINDLATPANSEVISSPTVSYSAALCSFTGAINLHSMYRKNKNSFQT